MASTTTKSIHSDGLNGTNTIRVVRVSQDGKLASPAAKGLSAEGYDIKGVNEMSEATRQLHDPEGIVLRYLEDPRPDLKDMIMVQYSGMVERIARRFAGIEPFEDLVQVGFIGLLNALSKFDGTAGVRFNTYATHLVAGEMKHYLRDRTQTIRQPAWLQELRHKVTRAGTMLQATLGRMPAASEIAAELGISTTAVEEVFQTQELLKVTSLDSSPTSDDDGSSDIENLDASSFCPEQLSVEDRVVLDAAMQQLRDLEREVLVLFHYESMNQTEIAHKLNISCNYVSHILRQSLGKLRRILSNEEASDRLLRRDSEGASDGSVDASTGIYNEDYFRSRLDEEIHRANSQSTSLAVIGIGFEGIEALGSYFGEVCVQDFMVDAAEFLKESMRRLDVVCRCGDRGFALILPGTNVNLEIVQFRLSAKFEDWLTARRAPSGTISAKLVSVLVPDSKSTAAEVIDAIQETVSIGSKQITLKQKNSNPRTRKAA